MKALLPECPARGGKPVQANCPVPLFSKDPEKGGPEDCLKAKLKFAPDDAALQQFDVFVRHFNAGTTLEWIWLCHQLDRVFDGQKLTRSRGELNALESVLQGSALEKCQVTLLENPNTTYAMMMNE